MKRRYATEIAELAETYEDARRGSPGLLNMVDSIAGQSTVFVGSGGALAVAQLAAGLHERFTGATAKAITPLQLAASTSQLDAAIVVVSASGSNVDARRAISVARRLGGPVGLITTRDRRALPEEVAPSVLVATVSAQHRDGFLATNSVMALSAALCNAYTRETAAPTLPWLSNAVPRDLRRRLVALTGGSFAPAVTDFETRIAELGLADIETTDYRNLAHGRHVGLARRLNTLTVIAFIGPEDEPLATKTLQVLPQDTHTVRLDTSLPYPAGVLDLIVASIRIVGALGEQVGVDPGMPGVPQFGRKLYSLPLNRTVIPQDPSPIERKVAASQLGSRSRSGYAEALASWQNNIRNQIFKGLVLDYDGTCCETHLRFDSPRREITDRLTLLLGAGLRLSFATGRGKSMHREARLWLPREHWSDVTLGLYNGSVQLRVSDEPDDYNECVGRLAHAAKRLADLDSVVPLDVTRRSSQISVSARPPARLTGPQLLPLVSATLARSEALDCKVVASGHSVDIFELDAGKSSLIEELSRRTQGAVLAIGDQGQLGGNDFEMLAATCWTLSVDRVSADPTRCWNLDDRGDSGPTLLLRYLNALHIGDDGILFRWDDE